jgi:hypothetical protein
LAPTTADRRRVRPSLLWLLLVPVLLVTGIGAAIALAVVTFVGVVSESLDFGPSGDLPAGEVTVWVAEADPPDRVRLLGPGDTDVPLTPVDDQRTVTVNGVRWIPGYTATIREPGHHRVEAMAGRAALRAPDQLHTDEVRRNGIVVPIALATASITLSLLVAITVFGLRALSTRRAA